MTFALVAAFFALLAAATLLLDRLPECRRREPLEDRLRPFLAREERWVSDVEAWVHRQ